MAYSVYIIQSETDGSYYVGSTSNVNLRVQRHNEGWSRSTKSKGPWKLVYSKEFTAKLHALGREREIKRMKSKTYIERLVRNAGGRPDPTG